MPSAVVVSAPTPHRARRDAPQRPPRSDGEQSRLRLREAALELFAQHGYAKTSTRAIARSAGTNVAAISYHFGDKAGLYREVFEVPSMTPAPPTAGSANTVPARANAGAPPLTDALARLFDGFIEPLRHGDQARQCMRLHLREVLEPSGLWDRGDACGFEAQHRELVASLARHFGLRRADAELHRLALCIAGLGVQIHLGRDLADSVAPSLNAGPRALAVWHGRLLGYALAMVEAEQQRRRESAPATVAEADTLEHRRSTATSLPAAAAPSQAKSKPNSKGTSAAAKVPALGATALKATASASVPASAAKRASTSHKPTGWRADAASSLLAGAARPILSAQAVTATPPAPRARRAGAAR